MSLRPCLLPLEVEDPPIRAHLQGSRHRQHDRQTHLRHSLGHHLGILNLT